MSRRRMPIIWCGCIDSRSSRRCTRTPCCGCWTRAWLRWRRGLFGLPTPHVAPGSDLTAAAVAEPRIARRARHHRRSVGSVAAGTDGATGITAPAHFDPPRGFDLASRRACVRRSTSCWHIRRGSCSWRSVHRVRKCWPRQSAPRDARPASGFASAQAWSSSPAARPRAPLWMQHAGLEWLHRPGAAIPANGTALPDRQSRHLSVAAERAACASPFRGRQPSQQLMTCRGQPAVAGALVSFARRYRVQPAKWRWPTMPDAMPNAARNARSVCDSSAVACTLER